MSTMNAEQRLKAISKIANKTFQDNGFFYYRDELWLIGMISDTTMSDDKLKEEIKTLKNDFPEYVKLFEEVLELL